MIEELNNAPEKTPEEERTDELLQGIDKEELRTLGQSLSDFAQTYMTQAKENAKAAKEMAAAALAVLNGVIKSDVFKDIRENLQSISAFLGEHREEIATLAEAEREAAQLLGFIQLEIENATDRDIAGHTPTDIYLQGINEETGEPNESKYGEIVKRAKQQFDDYKTAKELTETIETAAKELPRIIATPADKINYPLDKPNSIIWNLIEGADKNGQLKMRIDTSKKGADSESVILYSINFNELELQPGVKITKKLDNYDKLCYVAAAALYNAGNTIISATQVYRMMGYTGNPKAGDLKKVNDSLTKMGAARVYINNANEVKATKGGYAQFQYDAALLPFERKSVYINGQLTESAIHLFTEPPLITFAKERNQITTFTRQLLESPINKTDATLRIQDYLLERIARMKREKAGAKHKMLYSTIYENCNVTTAKQKQRARGKIEILLTHFKKCGWIKGFAEAEDGITIQLS